MQPPLLIPVATYLGYMKRKTFVRYRMNKLVGRLCLGLSLLFLAACAPLSPVATPIRTPTTALTIISPEAAQGEAEDTRQQRGEMVDAVTVDTKAQDQRVIEAMNTVQRHLFVPSEYADLAYRDTPLPIGYGQTISAPSIVMMMTELLSLQKGEKVLEIGTGSGYQAAVLAEAEDVEIYTIEIVPELAASAADRLKQLGYEKIQVKQADGYYGWEENAPFDAIIVTAAPDHLPAPLVTQLKDGGRLVIPIGPPGGYQTLWKFVKQDGKLKAYNIAGVSFVPFTGAGIQQEVGEETPLP